MTGERISEYLGVPKYRPTLAEDKNEIGIATGLAWTEAGGELLLTESTLMPGKGQLTLTGKLGDVMQESAQAAMSYVRAKAEDFGIPKEFNKKTDVHVHVPKARFRRTARRRASRSRPRSSPRWRAFRRAAMWP